MTQSLYQDKVVLITGANSGIGLGLVELLVEDQRAKLLRNEEYKDLVILFGSRSRKRGISALESLFSDLEKCQIDRNQLGFRVLSNTSIYLVQLDLCSVDSIDYMAKEYIPSIVSHIDVIYANAGALLGEGIDWIRGIGELFVRPLAFFTDVSVTLKQKVGVMVENSNTDEKLGMVFMANVFGHFLLISACKDLMKRESDRSFCPRVIWTGSRTSDQKYLDWKDIQAIKSKHSYESSKYLTDLVSYGIDQVVDSEPSEGQQHLRSFVCDPGVVSSSILGSFMPKIINVLIVAPLLYLASLLIPSVVYWPSHGAKSLLECGKMELIDRKNCVKYASCSSFLFRKSYVKEEPMFNIDPEAFRAQSSKALKYLRSLQTKIKKT